MPSTVMTAIATRLKAREIVLDDAQHGAAEQLASLAATLRHWRPSSPGLLAGWFGSKNKPPRGLYIHGKVGRGKTMLMDLFHDVVAFQPRRRIHFHAFMSEVHTAIARARDTVPGDPIPHVAADIAKGAQLLCFDEFHVTDIADAMILGRLFAGLFERQVVIVATSNVPPTDLYKNGLNRQLFEPFIQMISAHMDVLELFAAKDYRLDRMTGQKLYFAPLSDASENDLRLAFKRLTGQPHGLPRDISVRGRTVRIPEMAEGTAFMTFDDVCMKPLGAEDYIAFTEAFHTIVLSGVPRLSRDRRAEARRFITFIDTLYDARTGLILSADAEPDEIYPSGDESFLFERTASRLREMRTDDYLNRKSRPETR